jgi:hypothetical protein
VKKFDVHANQVTEWERQLRYSDPEVFVNATNSKEEFAEEVQALCDQTPDRMYFEAVEPMRPR